jgi:hypothetical protein
VYDRKVNDRELTFEASGGLINSSLVLQDRETDSYWPIMRGDAVAGKLEGTQLKELAINKKVKWKDWRREHPSTLVLSVDGREDDEAGYEKYFQSTDGFRGTQASDQRLPTKQAIFAFRWQGKSFAVPFSDFTGGNSWSIAGTQVFLFRAADAGLHASSVAFQTTDKLSLQNEGWHTANCVFNVQKEVFEGVGSCPQALPGFDTFWYNWSLNNPDTAVLR